MTQPSMGIGFEPVMDEQGNLFVTVHCRLGMLAGSMTIPENMIPQYIDGLRNTLADAHQMKKEAKREVSKLLGPNGQPVVPTDDVLDRMSPEDREELRQKVLNAARITD